MDRKSENLQALRGVASLMVVLYHLWVVEAAFGPQTLLFKEIRWFGFAGVDLFFVLSGFLITATNLRHLGRPSAVPGYLFRRFWRIYPTYWVTILLALLVAHATGGIKTIAADVERWWPMWAGLLPSERPNYLFGPAWTLYFEVMFYVAFGLLLFAPPRVAALALCAWGVWVMWVTAVLGRSEMPSSLGKQAVSPFVLEFLGGAAVAWLTTVRGARRWWRPALVLGIAWPVAWIVAMVVTNPGVFYGDTLGARRVLVFGPAAVLLVYAMAAAEGRWRVPRWLLRTGDASYSLYLIHPMMLTTAMYVGCLIPHNRVPHFLWLCGSLAAVLAAGFALHALVERPLLNLGRRKRATATRAETPPAPAPALAA